MSFKLNGGFDFDFEFEVLTIERSRRQNVQSAKRFAAPKVCSAKKGKRKSLLPGNKLVAMAPLSAAAIGPATFEQLSSASRRYPALAYKQRRKKFVVRENKR